MIKRGVCMVEKIIGEVGNVGGLNTPRCPLNSLQFPLSLSPFIPRLYGIHSQTSSSRKLQVSSFTLSPFTFGLHHQSKHSIFHSLSDFMIKPMFTSPIHYYRSHPLPTFIISHVLTLLIHPHPSMPSKYQI